MNRKPWIGSALLLGSVLVLAGVLAAWKINADDEARAAAANQPEPVEFITAAEVKPVEHRPVTTAVGTVVALRSVTLRNELPGTVQTVSMNPGDIVERGTVLVALDVSVERAELAARQAEAQLAETILERSERLRAHSAISQEELDRARAGRDVARAQIERIRAVIERKTIRAPFRARVGISDVHPGQYLAEGTVLTTLQGVDDAVHVDFAVDQRVAAAMTPGGHVQVSTRPGEYVQATVLAVDARVDPSTRNATVRARIDDARRAPAPGASVQVIVPTGDPVDALSVPASAVRKGPDGDHVFVLADDGTGQFRAHRRAVRVAAMDGERAVIEHGLQAGERIAAAGSFKLREDALVALSGAGASMGAGR